MVLLCAVAGRRLRRTATAGVVGLKPKPYSRPSARFFRIKISQRISTQLSHQFISYPGFGGPWNKLQIILVNGTFIMPQKKSFGQKFLNFMRGFKSAILAIFPFCQSGTFEPVHEIQNFFWPKAFP